MICVGTGTHLQGSISGFAGTFWTAELILKTLNLLGLLAHCHHSSRILGLSNGSESVITSQAGISITWELTRNADLLQTCQIRNSGGGVQSSVICTIVSLRITDLQEQFHRSSHKSLGPRHTSLRSTQKH